VGPLPCCASAKLNPTRTRVTASLPNQVYTSTPLPQRLSQILNQIVYMFEPD